jgi:probable HAF family extracellular repeat protein
MRTAVRVGLAALVLVVGRGLPAEGAQADGDGDGDRLEVTITPLTGRDGERLIRAFDINERGQVLVQTDADFADPSWPDHLDVVWHDGTVTPVGPPDTPAALFDISDRGHVAGVHCDVGLAGPCTSWTTFRWHDGTLTRLDVDGYRGLGEWTLNRRGDILGNDAQAQAVVWHAGGRRSVAPVEPAALPVDLNDRGQALVHSLRTERTAIWQVGEGVTVLGSLDGRRSAGVDINQAGHVAGMSDTADGATHAVLWRDDELVDLGTLGGSWAETIALNDRDQVIGESETATGERHAFLWDHDRMIDLGTLGGRSSRPTAINNRGQVVGVSQAEDGAWHGFLWDDGRMVDLTPAGALEPSSVANDINDRGQIVGQAFTGEGGGAVMWTVSRPHR